MTTVISHWSSKSQDLAKTILETYPEKRSAIMPLLYIASLEHEYVSQDAMREVAELVGITPIQVKSVASFYTMYKGEPVGDYLVSVCTGISCYLRDADEVLNAVEGATGGALDASAEEAPAEDDSTAEVASITVEGVECIGACGGAPAVQVNYELVEGVSPDKAEALVKWLTDAKPDVVLADEMQQLFGGQRSFEWGSTDSTGAVAPVPAFVAFGSEGEGR